MVAEPGSPSAGSFSGRGTSLGERSERLRAAPCTFHHAREGEAARSGGLPGRGEQQGPGRQAGDPAAGGSAARRAGAHARRVAARRYRSPGPDFLARSRARPRDNDTAPRGPLMALSWTCRRPAVGLTPRCRAGCAGQICLSPAHPRGESHSQMEGFQAEGGPTPYPHIALCATAPKSISGRRTGRMRSDVQKRCLPPRATVGPGEIQWPEPGLTASGTDSNPHETDLNPHGLVITLSDRSHVVVNRAWGYATDRTSAGRWFAMDALLADGPGSAGCRRLRAGRA